MNYNNIYISGDYTPDSLEEEKSAEIWMPKGTSIHHVYASIEAKKSRYPRSEFLKPPITIESAKNKNRQVLSAFSRFGNFKDISDDYIFKQICKGEYDKQFKQKKVVIKESKTKLMFADDLLNQVDNEPNSLLSINLKPEMGLVCVDIDNHIDSEENLNYENLNQTEGIILNSAMKTNYLVGELPFPQTKPIIIQTPRGLHLWYRLNLMKEDTPRIMKAIKNRREFTLRCGLKAELIANGFCAVVGPNYRVLCVPDVQDELSYLPPCFYPSATDTKNKPIEINFPIKVGSRWNTLKAMVETRQLVTSNTLLLNFVHENYCEENITEAELNYLKKEIERVISKEKGGKRAAKQAEEVLSLSLNEGDTFYRLMEVSRTEAGKNYDFLFLLKNVLTNQYMPILAIRMDWRPLAFLYTYAFGTTPGLGRALQSWLSDVQKIIAYTNETKWMLYDKEKGIWDSVSEDNLLEWIRNLISKVPQINVPVTVPFVQSVMLEWSSYIKQDIWMQPVTTYAYKDGLVVLGYPKAIKPHPLYKTRLYINAELKDSSFFSPNTADYLHNLCGESSSSLILLRLFLFRALFDVGKPSHFLYIKGPPASGKTLFEDLLRTIFGEQGVYSIPAYMSNSSFPFENCDIRNKFWILPDADKATVSERLLSIIKALSTSGTMVVQQKYKDAKQIKGISSIVICNEYLSNNSTPGPMLRRSILINPLVIPVSQRNMNLGAELEKNTGAFCNWITSTPHYLYKLLNYSHCLNCISNNWSVDSVSSFLQSIQKDLTVGPDLYFPLRTVIDKMGVMSIGIYDRYLNWCENAGVETPCELEVFKTVIAEYSLNVFFVPTHPETNDVFYNQDIQNANASKVYNVKSWYGVGYKAGEGVDLEVLIPAGVAALLLLSPNLSDDPFLEKNLDLVYKPQLTIDIPLPEILLVALHDWVKEGVDPILKNQTLLNRIKINDLLKEIQDKSDVIDKFITLDPDQILNKIIDSTKSSNQNLIADDFFDTEASQANIVFEPKSDIYTGPMFIPKDKILRLDKFEDEKTQLNKEDITGDNFFTSKGFYSYILNDLKKKKSLDLTLNDFKSEIHEINEPTLKKTFITKKLLFKLFDYYKQYINNRLNIRCVYDNPSHYKISKDTPLYEMACYNKMNQIIGYKENLNLVEIDNEDFIGKVYDDMRIERLELAEQVTVKAASDLMISPFSLAEFSKYNEYEYSSYIISFIIIRYDEFDKLNCYLTGHFNEDIEKINSLYSEYIFGTYFDILQNDIESFLDNYDLRNTSACIINIGILEALVNSYLKYRYKDLMFPPDTLFLKDIGYQQFEPTEEMFTEIKEQNKDDSNKDDSNKDDSNKDDSKYMKTESYFPVPRVPTYKKINKKESSTPQDERDTSFGLLTVNQNSTLYQMFDISTLNFFKLINLKKIKSSIKLSNYELKSKRMLCILGSYGTTDFLNIPSNIIDLIFNYFTSDVLYSEYDIAEFFKKVVIEIVKVYMSNAKLEISYPQKTIEFLSEVLNHNWKLPMPIPLELWKHGEFPGSLENEIIRDKWSKWPDYIDTPNALNQIGNKVLEITFYAYRIINTIIFFSNIKNNIFDSNGNINRPFYTKNISMSLFATKYEGSKNMKDPGRLSIKGTMFSNIKKEFRDIVVPEILNKIGTVSGHKFFIVDIKGCHSGIQASLLKEKTPFTYAAFTDDDPLDIWERISKEAEGTLPLKKYKPWIKKVYYAALNGGSIREVDDIVRHIDTNRVSSTDKVVYDEMVTFANIFKKLNIFRDLMFVNTFWKELNGTIYVPTRVLPVERKDEKGLPLSFKMPTLLYTTLEFIFIISIIRNVFEYFGGIQVQKVTLVQGIHDGVLFMTSDCSLDLHNLQNYVNSRLSTYTRDVLGGVSLKVTVTDCSTNTDWLSALCDTDTL